MTAMPRNNLQRNADYWAQRMKNMEDALLDQSYSYVENLDAQFRAAEAEIERQLSTWYRRFAANNDITLADAKRLLNSDELAEFRWTVEEYIKHGEENALTGAWMKELENASARVHISRLDALKIQLQQQAELLYSNQLDYIDRAARQSYAGSFYHTAYEVQKGLGVGWTMQAVNEGTITKVLSRPWTTDGQTFRDRCWTNKQSLVNSVNTQLTQMIIRGEAPDRAISAISKQFEVSRSKAGRLVMTESAYFSSAAQKDCFNSLGVERYVIVASFDRDTCGLCSALDGKVFKMSDYQVGLTAPPFHPWCRCCTAPYFEDMVGLGERWTRNPDGTTRKVPANTTFEQWRQSFVRGPTPGLPTASAGGTMATTAGTHFQSVMQSLPTAPSGYTDALEQHYTAGNQTAKAVFDRYVQPGSVANGAFSGTPHFDSRTQKVNMNFASDMTDPRGPATTFFHEHGHFVDFMSCPGSGFTSLQSADFGNALRADFDNYIKATMKAHGTRKKTDAYAIVAQELMDATHNAVSDLFGGLSRNRARGNYGHRTVSDLFGGLSRNRARGNYGHRTVYWTYSGMLEKEAFAHMFAAQFDADRYALMQQYFPTALVEFEKLLKGMI